MTQITPFLALIVLFLGACQPPQAENNPAQTSPQTNEVASAKSPEQPPLQEPNNHPNTNPEEEQKAPAKKPEQNTPAQAPNTPSSEKKYSILGKWRFQFPPQTIEEMQKANVELPVSIFTFTPEGKWTLVTQTSTGKRSISGSYALQGNQVTLTPKVVDGSPLEESNVRPLLVTISQDGNSFTAPEWQGGYFIRIKE